MSLPAFSRGFSTQTPRRPTILQAIHLQTGPASRRRRARHVAVLLRHVPHPGRSRMRHQALRAVAAALRLEQDLPQLAPRS